MLGGNCNPSRAHSSSEKTGPFLVGHQAHRPDIVTFIPLGVGKSVVHHLELDVAGPVKLPRVKAQDGRNLPATLEELLCRRLQFSKDWLEADIDGGWSMASVSGSLAGLVPRAYWRHDARGCSPPGGAG